MSNKKSTVVVKVIDSFTLAINKGTLDGVSKGDRYLIYHLDEEEIFDPVTNESLGKLEIVKGTGKVTHLQERMCTIKSDRYENEKKIIRRTGALAAMMGESIEEADRRYLPFDDAERGDYAKNI